MVYNSSYSSKNVFPFTMIVFAGVIIVHLVTQVCLRCMALMNVIYVVEMDNLVKIVQE